MEISDTINSIISQKTNRELWRVEPDDKVFDAITLMSLQNVGALLVMDGDVLAGIISERDYTRKVILAGRSSKDTAVQEIMTSPVYCIPPDSKVTDSLHLMSEKHIRHLPVVEAGKVIGIVSIGDLIKRVMASQETLIDQLESYLSATYHG
ncbi:MAG: CBS domain-containing protein [Verrucomicrobiales bacterium]|nr:CBS domain-containing protein [Verrucomicrobiales bacterium]